MIFIPGTKKLGLPKCYRWLEFIDTINIIKFHLLTERYFLQPWPFADVSIFVFFIAFLWFTYAVTALFEFLYGVAQYQYCAAFNSVKRSIISPKSFKVFFTVWGWSFIWVYQNHESWKGCFYIEILLLKVQIILSE